MSKLLSSIKPEHSQRFFLVCEKCGTQSVHHDEINPAKVIQKLLKEETRLHKTKEKLRPILSSCLGICPENKITALLVESEKPLRFFMLNEKYTENEISKLHDELITQLDEK